MSLDSDIANPIKKSGLLGRAVSFLKTSSPNIQEDHDSVNIEEFTEIAKSEDNTSFIENIRALNDGIELPHELFDLLKNKLDINRGCFCIKEPEGEFFTPHGSADLDKTTLHRLKLKYDSLKSYVGDGFSPAVFTGSDIVELKPLFSMRIFDSIEKIIFLPFTHDSDLIGVLIIIESGFLEENTIITVFNDIASEISALLSQSRFLNLNRISSFTPLPLAEITAQLENKIELTLSRNDKLSLLFIDLTDIISYLEEKSPDADIYRMRTDIISIFNSMVEGIGEVIQIDSERILLVLSSKTAIKDVILLNQIGLSLQSFFQHGESFPELKAVIKRIPEDGMDATVILNEIK